MVEKQPARSYIDPAVFLEQCDVAPYPIWQERWDISPAGHLSVSAHSPNAALLGLLSLSSTDPLQFEADGSWVEACELALQSGETIVEAEVSLVTSSGQHFRVQKSAKLPDLDTLPTSVIVFGKVLSEDESKRQVLDRMCSLAKVGAWWLDAETMLGEWTDEVSRIHDIENQNAVGGIRGFDFYVGESRKKIEEAVELAITRGIPYDLELEFKSARGVRKYVRTSCEPIIRNGKVVRLQGALQDITDLVTTRQALLSINHELEERVQLRTAEKEEAQRALKAILDAAPLQISYWDKNFHIQFANKSCANWFGMTEDQIIGRSAKDILGEDTYNRRKGNLDAAYAGETVVFEDSRYLSEEDAVRHVLVHYVPNEIKGSVEGIYVLVFDITTQKQMEASLTETRIELEQTRHDINCILDAIPYAVGSYDLNRNARYLNKAHTTWLGIDLNHKDHPHISEVFGEYYSENIQYIESVLAGVPQRYEYPIPSLEGSGVRSADVSLIPDIVDGKVFGFHTVIFDITDIARTKEALTHSNLLLEQAHRDLRHILDNVPCLVGYYDVNLRNRFANYAYFNWLGWQPEEIMGKNIREILGEQRFVEAEPYINQALLGKSQTFQRQFGNDAETPIRHTVTHYVPDIVNDKVVGFYILAIDISDQWKVQRKLEETNQDLDRSRRHLANILNNIPGLIGYYDRNLRNRFANYAYEDWIGISAEQLYGMHVSEILGEETMRANEHRFESVLKGSPQHFERTMLDQSGQLDRHVLIHYVPDINNGEIQGFYVLGFDITTQKETQASLERLNAELEKTRRQTQNVIDSMPSMVAYVNKNLENRFANIELGKWFNTEPNQLKGKSLADILGPSYVVSQPYVEGALCGEQQTFELKIFTESRPEGIPTLTYFIPDIDQNDEVKGFYIYAYDVSKLKATEKSLEHINKELEAFTYAVAHDLRAPLRAVSGFCAVLQDQLSEIGVTAVDEYITPIVRSVKRMSELIDGLLKLSRSVQGPLTVTSVDLSEIATELSRIFSKVIDNRSINWDIEPGITVEADPNMINTVMQNLLENAVKYTSKTANAKIRFYKEISDGVDYYCVSDNGDGFNSEYASNLFEPFQRLHRQEDFPGLGIGLATVARIIRRHSGTITATSEPQHGATFKFTIGK